MPVFRLDGWSGSRQESACPAGLSAKSEWLWRVSRVSHWFGQVSGRFWERFGSKCVARKVRGQRWLLEPKVEFLDGCRGF